ncbi:630_t:CDS:2, partial [Racocetra persica]
HQAIFTLCIRLIPEVATANSNSSPPYRSLSSVCEKVDFEILDDSSIGCNSESLEQAATSSLSSIYSANNTDSNINLYDNSYDLQFDKTAIKMAKAYASLSSKTIQEHVREIDINWLAQDLDSTSNRESLWEATTNYENELNIKLNSGDIKHLNRTCIIVDNSNETI